MFFSSFLLHSIFFSFCAYSQEDEEYASIAELRDKMQRLMETQDSTQQYNEETETQTQLMHFQDQLTRLTHDREARYDLNFF